MRRQPGSLRIIGGQWRRRTIMLSSNSSHIRPTADRIRETLFNWLMHHIQNARCLDCFAGSGILGFEALSRGARHVVMCDHDLKTIAQLEKTAFDLNCEEQVTLQTLDWSQAPKPLWPESFDIIFLDPPFHKAWLEKMPAWLNQYPIMTPGGWIYMEFEKGLDLTDLPDTWQQQHLKHAGQVSYGLWQFNP